MISINKLPLNNVLNPTYPCNVNKLDIYFFKKSLTFYFQSLKLSSTPWMRMTEERTLPVPTNFLTIRNPFARRS